MRFRTQRLNEVVRLIFNTGAGSGENKNGQTEEKIDLSTSVAGSLPHANQLLRDIRSLAGLLGGNEDLFS